MSPYVYPIKVSKLPFKNYCYLVVASTTKEAVLLDPAWEVEKIEQQLRISRANLKAILLTHHHIDHVNLATEFARRYNVPVRMSQAEIDYYDFSCHNLVPLEKNEEFSIGCLTVTPLFTPGHTIGATSYWIGNNLFSGDTLFTEGCGMCFGKGGDASAMFDSLAGLKEKIPAHTRIYPGHSYGKEPGHTFAYLLKNNIYLQFTRREDFVEFRMRKNQRGLMEFC